MEIKKGSSRVVVCAGSFAVKIPRATTWRSFVNGLSANQTEREFSCMSWANPVFFSIGPLLTVQRRAVRLATDEEVNEFRDSEIIRNMVENKRSSIGLVNGKLVAIDFG